MCCEFILSLKDFLLAFFSCHLKCFLEFENQVGSVAAVKGLRLLWRRFGTAICVLSIKNIFWKTQVFHIF